MSRTDFAKELEQLINKHSMENQSDTPDFILAEFMMNALQSYERAIYQRTSWYGIEVPIQVTQATGEVSSQAPGLVEGPTNVGTHEPDSEAGSQVRPDRDESRGVARPSPSSKALQVAEHDAARVREVYAEAKAKIEAICNSSWDVLPEQAKTIREILQKHFGLYLSYEARIGTPDGWKAVESLKALEDADTSKVKFAKGEAAILSTQTATPKTVLETSRFVCSHSVPIEWPHHKCEEFDAFRARQAPAAPQAVCDLAQEYAYDARNLLNPGHPQSDLYDAFKAGWAAASRARPVTYTCMDCARKGQDCPHPLPKCPVKTCNHCGGTERVFEPYDGQRLCTPCFERGMKRLHADD